MATNEVRWHPEAIVDAESARDWYADRSPLAARGFLLALDNAVAEIVDHPERWPADLTGRRLYIFPSHYPYTLVFRITDAVEVVAVAHQRRHPGYWRRR